MGMTLFAAFLAKTLRLFRGRRGIVGAMLLIIGFGVFTSLPGQAQFAVGNCEEEPLTIAALFNPANYFPLIPVDCGTDGEGNALALSIEQAPDVLLRGYGAITSLVLYFGVFYLIYAGILWIVSGVNQSERGKALKAINTAVVSIVLVLSAHIIVNTIVIILGLGQYANMSVADFFVD